MEREQAPLLYRVSISAIDFTFVLLSATGNYRLSKIREGNVLEIQQVSTGSIQKCCRNTATKAKHQIRRDFTEQRSLWGFCL